MVFIPNEIHYISALLECFYAFKRSSFFIKTNISENKLRKIITFIHNYIPKNWICKLYILPLKMRPQGI